MEEQIIKHYKEQINAVQDEFLNSKRARALLDFMVNEYSKNLNKAKHKNTSKKEVLRAIERLVLLDELFTLLSEDKQN